MAIQLGNDGDEDAPIMDINTTPLIDVMLVLLVMLIITIPIQLHAVDLRLPPPGAVPPAVKPEVVRIEIDAAQTVRWNGVPLADAAELDRRFQEAAQRSPQPVIELRPEARAKYRSVARVMVGADRAGLQALGVAALP